jgi:hypothetical protein
LKFETKSTLSIRYDEMRNEVSMFKTLKSLGALFNKHEKVFGIRVFGTREVNRHKFDHAANILREYLDNDVDGKADSQKIVKALKSEKAVLTIFSDEDQREKFLGKHERKFEKAGANIQTLWDTEIITTSDNTTQFDASLEEIFHLISDFGYSKVYPEEFGRKRDSLIGKIMNNSRGGYFKKVPSEYPEGAYFTYDDKTCDYECQVTEYFYWGMTSLLGAQEAAERFEQIQDEWRLNTPAKVAEEDPELFDLLTNKKYSLPSVLPDGLI